MRGIHRSLVNSPHKGQWRGALAIFVICAWIDGWVNSREAGDLRHHRAHYDVNVMVTYTSVQKYGMLCQGWHLRSQTYPHTHVIHQKFHYNDVSMTAMAFQITVYRLFNQPFLQEQIKENTKAPCHWLCVGNPSVSGGFPLQRASNAANVSFWWRHHATPQSVPVVCYWPFTVNHKVTT